MQFITEIIVAILTAYLAFTNSLADKIIEILPETEVVEETELPTEETEEDGELISLPSDFSGMTVPDIILKSLDYQKATAIDADQRKTYTDEPLLALVNIYCTFTTENTIRTTTGTGFFIDDSGVIMTNAHVAQYLLLGTTNLLGQAECFVRTGDPARAEYKAELLYMPPIWVEKNASIITAKTPTGTGERDYALLLVTESVTTSPLPARFPALKVNSESLEKSIVNDAVTLAGYPATSLLKNGAKGQLLPVVAESSISELYTFGSNRADVFSLTGSEAGAEGSSGGPVISEAGEVIGMIVTRGNDEADGEGSLRAITLAHIERTITEETGFSLKQTLSGDVSKRSGIFKGTIAPFLVTILSEELGS